MTLCCRCYNDGTVMSYGHHRFTRYGMAITSYIILSLIAVRYCWLVTPLRRKYHGLRWLRRWSLRMPSVMLILTPLWRRCYRAVGNEFTFTVGIGANIIVVVNTTFIVIVIVSQSERHLPLLRI